MSALIWLAIVTVWGFVLIPMWLRRHDSTVEQRSMERFTTARRVISKRNTPPVVDASAPSQAVDGSEQEEPDSASSGEQTQPETGTAEPGAPEAAVHPGTAAGHDGPGRATATPPAEAARRVDAERRSLMRLRKRRLFLLLGALPVTVVLAIVLGGTWVLAQLLVDAGLFIYCLHLRRAARADRRLRVSRATRDRRIAAERAARTAGHTASASAHARGRRHVDAGSASGAEAGKPQAGGQGEAGEGTEPAARWATDDYSPIRLSDTIPPVGSTGILSEAELALARAETVDLGELTSRSTGRGDTEPVADGDTDGDAEGMSDAELPGGEGSQSGQSGEDGLVDQGSVATAYGGHGRVGDDEDGSEYGYDDEAVRASPGRPAPRLPSARPTTSKPGRVQVNPPGTHSGTTTPPTPARAGGAPVPGEGTGGDPDDLAPLLRRRAVGH